MKQGSTKQSLWRVALLVVSVLLVVSCGPTPAPPAATEPPAAPTEAAAATEPPAAPTEAPPTEAAEPAPPAAEEQVLVIATDLDVNGLDPAVVYDLTMRNLALVYEGLVTLKGGTIEIIPALAESWDISEDGLTYTFHLREGVKFHDGSTLTADAVKKSFDRFMEIGKTTAWMFKDVLQEVNAVDDLTVEMVLSRPYSPFLSLLTAVSGPSIVSGAALDEHMGDDLAQGWLFDHEAGSGPYMLESWDPGQQTITFVKFPDYWGGWEGQRIEKIVMRYVVETSTRKLMLETGEVDMAISLTPDELESLEGVEGIYVDEKPTMRIFLVFMNTQNGPLADKKVRQALAYAMDYEGVWQYVYNGNMAPLCGPLPSNDPAAFPCDEYPYKLDMEKAKALLAESSYPEGGFTLELLNSQDFAFRKTAEILQAQLAELNIQVNITEQAWASVWEQIGKLETMPDVIPLRNYPDFPDSSSIYANQYASAAWGELGWNISYYKNEQFDALLEAVTVTTDPEERARLFREMAEIVIEDVPNLFVGNLVSQVAMRDNVKGYVLNPVFIFKINAYEMYKE